MYAVPAKILNQIAQTQTLKHPWANLLFRKTDQEKQRILESQADALEQAGVPQKVAFLYQTLGPLLAENEAISHYIQKTDSSDLRMTLPEITTVPEALRIADLERPMTDRERKMLASLLIPLAPQ
jgi:hypothetical protein